MRGLPAGWALRGAVPNSPRERERRATSGTKYGLGLRGEIAQANYLGRVYRAARAREALDELADEWELRAALRRFYLEGGRL